MRVNKSAMVTDEHERKRSWFPVFILGFLVGMLTLAAVTWAGSRPWATLANFIASKDLKFHTSQPVVVNKIQQLQRLETVTYSLDKIIEGDRQSSILPDFLAGDKLLLVVHGEAIAGVDLGQLRPEDVRINGRNIQVHLPQSQIFITALDNTKTRVYSRTTGLLVPRDPNLESEVRATAQNQIQQAALAGGILNNASKNAEATVQSMLLGLGFEHVEFD